MGGNHEIWHKDAFKGGEFKFIRSRMKSDERTITRGFMFFVRMFACKDKNANLFNFRIFLWVTPIERPREE